MIFKATKRAVQMATVGGWRVGQRAQALQELVAVRGVLGEQE